LVGSTTFQTLFESEFDVLLLLYNPHCAGCNALMPQLDKVFCFLSELCVRVRVCSLLSGRFLRLHRTLPLDFSSDAFERALPRLPACRYTQAAQVLGLTDPDVIVARIDLTANDICVVTRFESYPTVLYYQNAHKRVTAPALCCVLCVACVCACACACVCCMSVRVSVSVSV
jgi:hypothetical protein